MLTLWDICSNSLNLPCPRISRWKYNNQLKNHFVLSLVDHFCKFLIRPLFCSACPTMSSLNDTLSSPYLIQWMLWKSLMNLQEINYTSFLTVRILSFLSSVLMICICYDLLYPQLICKKHATMSNFWNVQLLSFIKAWYF